MSHDDDDLGSADPRLWRSARFWWAVVSWVFIGVSLSVEPGGVRVALFAAAILAGGHGFAREAVERLREGREVGIDLLMAVAVVGAAAIGRWQEAALVAALFSISEALEEFAVRRTRHAIRNLMDRVPPRAHALRPEGEIEVDLKDVVKRDSRDVVARQDDAPFVGTAGRLEPEARLADAPTRIDTLEAALRTAGVLKGP